MEGIRIVLPFDVKTREPGESTLPTSAFDREKVAKGDRNLSTEKKHSYVMNEAAQQPSQVLREDELHSSFAATILQGDKRI